MRFLKGLILQTRTVTSLKKNDLIDRENNQDNRHIIPMKSQGFSKTPQEIMEEYNGCSVPQY
jgi:hypothetical protein